jgi:DNA-binding NarL/FixJ family response regulator
MTTPRIAGLMIFVAATLVVASTLHLTGVFNGGKPPHGVNRAGIAEAIIAVALLAGALALVYGKRRFAIGAIAFAIAGFGVGLSMTAREGAAGDIAYHVTMLPILLFTLLAASRTRHVASSTPKLGGKGQMPAGTPPERPRQPFLRTRRAGRRSRKRRRRCQHGPQRRTPRRWHHRHGRARHGRRRQPPRGPAVERISRRRQAALRAGRSVIRVLVADDQAAVRGGFAALIHAQENMDIAGEASNGREAVDLARRVLPHVALMDIRMPVLDGLEATRMICTDPTLARTRVLVLTTFDLDEYVYNALRAGASGFLLKDTRPRELLHAIEVIAAGDAMISPNITRRLIAEFAARKDPATTPAALVELTEREREILNLVAHGLATPRSPANS